MKIEIEYIIIITILRMASYKIDKLQKLVEEENKIKEQKRILMEEIELEIEIKRRLELESTITKLRTQVGELSKNIEGEIMFNNSERNQIRTNFKNTTIHQGPPPGNPGYNNRYKPITLSEFLKNISHLSEQERKQQQTYGEYDKRLFNIPIEIKIYHDMIPILTTIMGILDKQQKEINNFQ